MEFVEYAWFLDSNKYGMACAWHLGRIMKRQEVLKNSICDKTKRCGIESSHDSFNVYGCIWKDIGV
jgi:hypothetical protein